ncbi:MAG: YggS family pyridoxal phosphate-dependent enzyme [Polyangiaceae bacterium]
MSAIARALGDVRARIEVAARAAGRDPESVTLVAVSKFHDAAAIREAHAAGQRDFGESYAQELVAKAEALRDLPDLRWHFVGGLQSNKAKYVARIATLVHSVGSEHVARELAKRAALAGRAPLDVLVEVNVGGELQKHGVAPADLADVLRAIRTLSELRVVGLMTIPPDGTREEAAAVFATLASLRALHGGASGLPGLSMGMSGDLEEAIRAGATYVRIGTAIFGERRAGTLTDPTG